MTKDQLWLEAREGIASEIQRRWEERRDPERLIRSPADLSDQELVSLLAAGKPEVVMRSIEDLSDEELALARIGKRDNVGRH